MQLLNSIRSTIFGAQPGNALRACFLLGCSAAFMRLFSTEVRRSNQSAAKRLHIASTVFIALSTLSLFVLASRLNEMHADLARLGELAKKVGPNP
jgi:hypothetical protein